MKSTLAEMFEMNTDPIPDWEERLKTTVQTLSEALQLGFSIRSSPVEPLLEVLVDLALQLKYLLQEGFVTWEAKSNKLLKFSKTDVDVLNNPKVLTSEVQRHVAWDPQLSNFFGELAQTLVSIKRHHELPKDLYSSGKHGSCPSDPKQHRIKNGAVYHFYRRQSRKSKKL